jgi:signal transduction histidine kinase/CheY-like chemotaxis protein
VTKGYALISSRNKILVVLLGFFALLIVTRFINSAYTAAKYRQFRIDQLSRTVAFEAEKVGKVIAEMERNAIDLALTGSLFYESGSRRSLGESVSINNFDAFRAAVGGGIWYEPYAINKNVQRTCFYAYYDSEKDTMVYDPGFETERYDYHTQVWYKQIKANIKQKYKSVWTVPYYDDEGTLSLMTTVGSGIFSKDGQFVGMSTVDWQIDSMVDHLSKIQPTNHSFVLLASPLYDHIITNTSGTEVHKAGTNLSTLPWWNTLKADLSKDNANKDEASRDTVYVNNIVDAGKKFTAFSRRFDNGWVFSVQIPSAEIFSEIEKLNLIFTLIIVVPSAIILALIIYMLFALPNLAAAQPVSVTADAPQAAARIRRFLVLRKMSKLINSLRNWSRLQLAMQIAFTALAFATMVIVSYFLMTTTVKQQLLRSSKAMFNQSQAKIDADLQEPKAILGVFSQMIQYLVLDGKDMKTIRSAVVDFFENTEEHSNIRMSGSEGVFGYITPSHDQAEFVHGNRNWVHPPNYDARNRLWYTEAIRHEGKIVETGPFADIVTKKLVFTYSRTISSDAGARLAVVGINIPMEAIADDVVSAALTHDGYGVLIAKDLTLLAHPKKELVGKNTRDEDIAFRHLADDLAGGKEISERQMTNFRGESSIAFFKRLENGWSLGLVTPRQVYYQSVTQLGWYLISLGILLFGAVSFILLRIDLAKSRADAMNVQKSAFLAQMSHEIRTPMNAIIGISEIQLENPKLPSEIKEAMSMIFNSANVLLSLINDILDLSKIESGKMELTPTDYYVASVIHDTAQLNSLRIESKSIDFKINVDKTIPSVLHGDDLRIKQILNNLLSNAAKYTKDGEVGLSVTSEPDPSDPSAITLVFSISDTGQGMSAEQIATLFDKYTRYNLDANRKIEGTGLGMNITKSLVHMMNGEISVNSQPGKGSVFTVRLPQVVSNSSELGDEVSENLQEFRQKGIYHKKETHIMREFMPYGNILVVDDVQTNLYVAKGLSVPYGLQFDSASSGFEALEKIKDGKVYDVIFMDHMMPEMDGIETVKKMREQGYVAPIVALTANAMAGQAKIFLANGFDDFISKPIDTRQYNAILNKLVRDKQPPEVIEAARQQQKQMSEKNAVMSQQPQKSEIDPELLGIAMHDTEKAIAELEGIYEKRDSFKDEDLRKYTVCVHGMKTVLANIGETELSQVAYRLEQAGNAGNLAVITAYTQTFLDELRQLIRSSKPTETSDDAAVDEDTAFLREKLLALLATCESFDIGTAEAIMSELKHKAWGHQTKELLGATASHLLHSNFDEAVAVVQEFLNADTERKK